MRSFAVAKVLIVNEHEELLVLRRSPTDTRRPGQWDMPGGWVDDNEDAWHTAIREAAEEAGLQVTPKLIYAETDPTDPYGNGIWLAFLARVQGRPKVTISYEHDAAEWLPLGTALKEFTYPRQQRMIQYLCDHNLLDEG